MKLSLQKASQYVSKGLNINPDKMQDCFSPATNVDLEGLIELRTNLFDSQPLWDDKSYLKWRYSFDDNSDNHNKIWLFKIDSNIVACLGVEEVTLCINNRETVFSNNEMSLNGRGIIIGLLFVDNADT